MDKREDFLSSWKKEFKEKLDEFDKNIGNSRQISRDSIYKIIILSASIVGFSVSLFSIPILQSSLNLDILKYSWYFFLSVIILGFFVLLSEGRIKYAITWKGFQLSQYPEDRKYLFKEKFYAFLIVIITLFYLANLLFNKIYQDEKEKLFKEKVNGLVVNNLAWIEHFLIFIENIIFILFILGLVLLVSSFARG